MRDALVRSEIVDHLANRLAELLEPRLVAAIEERLSTEAATPRLVDANALALELGLTRAWVYEHAEELGVIRVGDGERPRLRFDVDRAREAVDHSQRPSRPAPSTSRRRTRSRSSTAALLPIRGRTP